MLMFKVSRPASTLALLCISSCCFLSYFPLVCGATTWHDVANTLRHNMEIASLNIAKCKSKDMVSSQKCADFFKKMLEVESDEAKSLDRLDQAESEKDFRKVWDLRIRIAEQELKLAELAKLSWEQSFFPNKWSAAKNGRKSLMMSTYTQEIEKASAIRDSFCSVLEKKDECERDWTAFVNAIQKTIDSANNKNSASDSADRTAYLNANISEDSNWLEAVRTNSRLRHKYFGE